MLTEKDYCDYETRKELIKLGYPAHLYDNTEVDKILGAILLYEVQKWLREEKGTHIEIDLQFLSEEKRWYWGFTIIHFDNPHVVSINGDYSSYEETLSEAIKEAVKILKED